MRRLCVFGDFVVLEARLDSLFLLKLRLDTHLVDHPHHAMPTHLLGSELVQV
jgi:hypothetical protein